MCASQSPPVMEHLLKKHLFVLNSRRRVSGGWGGVTAQPPPPPFFHTVVICHSDKRAAVFLSSEHHIPRVSPRPRCAYLGLFFTYCASAASHGGCQTVAPARAEGTVSSSLPETVTEFSVIAVAIWTPPPPPCYYTGWQDAHWSRVGENMSSFTSEIWPQSYVITLQQSIHRFFNQRHIARVVNSGAREETQRTGIRSHVILPPQSVQVSSTPSPTLSHLVKNEWSILRPLSLTFARTPRTRRWGSTTRKDTAFFVFWTLPYFTCVLLFFSFSEDRRRPTYSFQCSNSNAGRMRIPDHNIQKQRRRCWW